MSLETMHGFPLNAEGKLKLSRFQLRWYQEDLWDAIENKGYRKVLAIHPRRAGKDISAWNLCIRQCLTKICLVYYALPTYAQARKAIFDAISHEGVQFLEYIPKELIDKINVSEMKIRFKNGSILQCIGADSYETSLVGTNPYAIVFSEWSRMTPKAYEFARPILAAGRGWCMMLTTPFGHNHAWHHWKLAQELDDWYVVLRKTSEIHHIDEDLLAEEKAQMDPGLYAQEYECDWDRGVEGSYYGTFLENLRQNGRICSVPWEPQLQVHVVLDIGVNDATSLLFFQTTSDNSSIRIIDAYSRSGVGLDHYVKVMQDKPYIYGKYFAPFDIRVREWGGGAITRFEKAAQMGINFTLLDQIGVMDGIENVWAHFPKFWIDADKCRNFISALENYRKEWNEERNQFDNKPVKNWTNHYADALRYLCMSLHKTSKGLTAEEFARQKAKALYGDKHELPRFFRPDSRYENYRP